VALHTGLGRRQTRERRVFDRRVTVAAVESEAPDVPLVAEGNGLLKAHTDARVEGRPHDQIGDED
jgi:hypothetical protein